MCCMNDRTRASIRPLKADLEHVDIYHSFSWVHAHGRYTPYMVPYILQRLFEAIETPHKSKTLLYAILCDTFLINYPINEGLN